MKKYSITQTICKKPLRAIVSLLIVFLFSGAGHGANLRERMTLDGEWQYRLAGIPSDIPGEGVIDLPGTLDEAHRTIYNPESDNTTQLRREFYFSGEATYRKRIFVPGSWEGKDIELFLERTKPSRLLIDGKEAGKNSRISSPQRYDLTDFLTPGAHWIELVVNNSDSLPPIVNRSSHAASENTQTNWNGILGDMHLEARNPFHIRKVEVGENLQEGGVNLKIRYSKAAPEEMALRIVPSEGGGNPVALTVREGAEETEVFFPLTGDGMLWSAPAPNMIDFDFIVTDSRGKGIDSYSLTTGVREFKAAGKGFENNGKPVFLRGTVNAAVFPATAYAPIDVESWEKYFRKVKEYGLNHVRFHSWTPPEAAFVAADKTGVYLQTELPLWGEFDKDMKFTNRFMEEELEGIIESYSHHPSFVMFSTGNELWGDISLMGEYMSRARKGNPRLLATYGSNVYLGMNGEIGGEDFIVAAKTSDEIENSIRGSVSFADSPDGGYFNSTYPNSSRNYEKAAGRVSKPLVAHEVGQYQSYPDFATIGKYASLLKPDNLKEFRNRAIEAGNYGKNSDYASASSQWAAKLYKAEMEMLQRTPGISGYQLFGLQDYPGQGTALVGVLDPFMDSKGGVTPEEWRESAGDVLVLAEFPKFSFTEGERVEVPVKTVNYSLEPAGIETVEWDTGFDSGRLTAGKGYGLLDAGKIVFEVPVTGAPQKYTLSLNGGQNITNSYDFWSFPEIKEKKNDIAVTGNLTEALILLDQGATVVLCPDSVTTAAASVDGLFTPDFWNYRMFRTICDEMGLKPSPGTMGLLIDSDHPSLSKFPSENHTDWQWWAIVVNSRPLIIDRLPKDVNPIIEVIDNVERNFRLALMLECKVGKGKLIILATDMAKAGQYPEGRWLMESVKEYAASKEFKPAITLSAEQLVNLVSKPSTARKLKELRNETYDSHWE